MSDMLLNDVDLEELSDWDDPEVATMELATDFVADEDENQTLEPSNPDPQKKKDLKKKVPKPVFRASLEKEKLQQIAAGMTKSALEKAQHNEQFTMKYGYGSNVISVAKNIFQQISSHQQEFETFAQDVVSTVAEAVAAGDKASSGKAQELIWTKFHCLRTSAENKKKWSSFLDCLGISTQGIVSALLHQYLLRTILSDLILLQRKENGEQKKDPPKHSDHDMQILRYISGFIPFSLLKKYKKMKSEQAQRYTHILKGWRLNDEKIIAPTFLSYTVTWINLQNRGGLFQVRDDVFRFFRTLERVSGCVLKNKNLKKISQSNVKQMLSEQLSENPHVLKTWKDVASCDDTTLKALFCDVISKWIMLRVNAFVKAFNLLKKTQKQASKKGEKSLRKELKK